MVEVDAISSNLVYEVVKRFFDVACSLILLSILLPFFLLVALVIKIDSKGPVLYFGERVGLNNKKFKIYKFRTMRPNAELHGTTTTINDPRITKIGTFLRKYKLDELPQLINVIKGDMSLVGPRPEVEEHTSEYSEEEKQILSVRPGITDYSSIEFYNLAEVLGPNDPHRVYVTKIRSQKNQLRLLYVKNKSFSEDIKILFNTSKLLMNLISGRLKKD